jgi:hypothetical protein
MGTDREAALKEIDRVEADFVADELPDEIVKAREDIHRVMGIAGLIADAENPEKHYLRLIAEHMGEILVRADVRLNMVEDKIRKD